MLTQARFMCQQRLLELKMKLCIPYGMSAILTRKSIFSLIWDSMEQTADMHFQQPIWVPAIMLIKDMTMRFSWDFDWVFDDTTDDRRTVLSGCIRESRNPSYDMFFYEKESGHYEGELFYDLWRCGRTDPMVKAQPAFSGCLVFHIRRSCGGFSISGKNFPKVAGGSAYGEELTAQ